jgi:hypothetical protein
LGQGTTEAFPSWINLMHAICCNMAALAVAGLYYYWRSCMTTALQDRSLRERVACLLWAVAAHAD